MPGTERWRACPSRSQCSGHAPHNMACETSQLGGWCGKGTGVGVGLKRGYCSGPVDEPVTPAPCLQPSGQSDRKCHGQALPRPVHTPSWSHQMRLGEVPAAQGRVEASMTPAHPAASPESQEETAQMENGQKEKFLV